MADYKNQIRCTLQSDANISIALDKMIFFSQSKSIDIFLISPQKRVMGTH